MAGEDRHIVAEVGEGLPLCRSTLLAIQIDEVDATTREADCVGDFSCRMKPARTCIVVRQQDCGRDIAGGAFLDQLVDEIVDERLRIGRIEPDAAVPWASEAILFGVEVFFGLNDCLCLGIRGGIEVNSPRTARASSI
jgi:hypothetical protein